MSPSLALMTPLMHSFPHLLTLSLLQPLPKLTLLLFILTPPVTLQLFVLVSPLRMQPSMLLLPPGQPVWFAPEALGLQHEARPCPGSCEAARSCSMPRRMWSCFSCITGARSSLVEEPSVGWAQQALEKKCCIGKHLSEALLSLSLPLYRSHTHRRPQCWLGTADSGGKVLCWQHCCCFTSVNIYQRPLSLSPSLSRTQTT